MTGSLTDKIQQQQNSLKGLQSHLKDIHSYLGKVVSGDLKVNHSISYLLQDVFNLIPNMESEELVSAMTIKTSDQMLVMYLGSLVRATIALHNLIDNKEQNQRAENEADEKAKKGNYTGLTLSSLHLLCFRTPTVKQHFLNARCCTFCPQSK